MPPPSSPQLPPHPPVPPAATRQQSSRDHTPQHKEAAYRQCNSTIAAEGSEGHLRHIAQRPARARTARWTCCVSRSGGGSAYDPPVMRALRVADLFAGAGGLSEGFRQAGFHVLAGADSDPDACATYRANFPEASTLWGDLRDPAMREQASAVATRADVLVGGPPCQAFSQVRNYARLINDPRNALYREFVTIVSEAKPLALVMENVPGMAQMGVQEQIAADLGLDGEYRVRPQLLDAANFGVPQTRKRLVFIGIRADLAIDPPTLVGSGATSTLALERVTEGGQTAYRVASLAQDLTLGGEPAVSATRLEERLEDPDDDGLVTVSQALSDLIVLSAGRRELSIPVEQLPEATSAYQRAMRKGADQPGATIGNVDVPRMNADTALRLASLPPGGNYRDLPESLQRRYLSGQKWGPHNGTGQLGRRHYYAYRRLHPSIWAWTLNTKADSVYHWSSPRGLSVREFARLQSFPDTFTVMTDPRRGELAGRLPNGPAHSRYRQLGNAVPPRLAAAVATALAATLRPQLDTVPTHGG